ncbi:hypothetical protein HY025_00335 [Candidatus Daviesbacteria bacterium]|nr:hypothetical protein [Candidatus Daviesbacteria bacterium]
MSIFGQANTRVGMVFLTQDIEYTRYVILDHIRPGLNPLASENLLLPFFWIKRYLTYYQSGFLFFNGLNMTQGNLGLGVLYLFELPFLVVGFIKLIRDKVSNYQFFLTWIGLGFIPASLTNNVTDAGRSLLVVPALMAVISVGLIACFEWLKRQTRVKRFGISIFYIIFILIILTQTFLVFAVHFPQDKGEAFMEGTKESVLYAISHKDQYSEVVYDPKRGTEAGDVVSIPHMYILFYSKYDPATYQQEVKNFKQDFVHFDKYTIRAINWAYDRKKIGVLFIGSPWSLEEKDLKSGQILDKIYLANGKLALLIVTP